MIKLKVKVVDELTREPVKDARVFICEDTGDKPDRSGDRLFMNTVTNADGVAETRAFLTNDIHILIRVRCANYDYYMKSVEYHDVIGPNKELDMLVEAMVDGDEPEESVISIIKNMFKGAI